MLRDFLLADEFLFLVPFLVWGGLRLGWSFPRKAAVLFVWVAAIVLFHLPYAALRLRDLLSVFPVFALLSGMGIADALTWTSQIRRPLLQQKTTHVAASLILLLLWTRSYIILPLVLPGTDFAAFGMLQARQRAAFDTLASLTSPDAVVASTLNGGPIQLYAGRETVHPADWTGDEWLRFVSHVLAEDRSIYLLVDGAAMQQPFQEAVAHYPVIAVSSLPLPYFYPDGSSDNREVPLYRIAVDLRR